MNGEYKEFIELTAEVTARRLIEELCKRLPCEKQATTLERIDKRMNEVEHAEVNHYNDIAVVEKKVVVAEQVSKDALKAVNGLWWKILTAVVIPLAIFMFVQKWI